MRKWKENSWKNRELQKKKYGKIKKEIREKYLQHEKKRRMQRRRNDMKKENDHEKKKKNAKNEEI